MKILTIIAALFGYAIVIDARILTLNVVNYGPASNGVAEVTIEAYEVAEVMTYRDNTEPGRNTSRTKLAVLKDNRGTDVSPDMQANPFTPVFVAGPATLQLRCDGLSANGFCTIRISVTFNGDNEFRVGCWERPWHGAKSSEGLHGITVVR